MLDTSFDFGAFIFRFIVDTRYVYFQLTANGLIWSGKDIDLKYSVGMHGPFTSPSEKYSQYFSLQLGACSYFRLCRIKC